MPTTDFASTVHLTPDQLAERWQTSKGQLANLRSAGTGIPYIKLGNRVLYRLADVLDHEEDMLVTPIGGTR